MKALLTAAAAIYFVVTTTALLHAQARTADGSPTRIDGQVALRQIVKRVDPLLSADVIAKNPGAFVTADLVIRTDGTVESVTVLFGPDALRAPAVAAARQWTFKAFMNGGVPGRVVAAIDIVGTLANPAAEAARNAYNNYSDMSLECQRAFGAGVPDALTICESAVRAAEALPADRVLERVSVLRTYGVALGQSRRSEEALAQFARAIEVAAPELERARAGRALPVANWDAETGTMQRLTAQAHYNLGNLANADEFLAKAISSFERALADSPSYAGSLNQLLRDGALVKRAMGREDDARALEARAEAVIVPPRNVPAPFPTPRRSGTVLLLGSIGPQFTDDDVRQISALVPGGKKVWFISGLTAGPRLQADVYLEADSTSPALRKGNILLMEARVPAGDGGRRTWEYIKLDRLDGHAQIPMTSRDPSDVRGNDDMNQPFRLMYFEEKPKPLTDDEVVSLVTFVRRAAGTLPSALAAAPNVLSREVQSWPIVTVAVGGFGRPDEIAVEVAEGRLINGPRQEITVKRGASGWEIVALDGR